MASTLDINDLYAIVTALMLSGGFNDEQLGFAAIEARQIIKHTTGREVGEIVEAD